MRAHTRTGYCSSEETSCRTRETRPDHTSRVPTVPCAERPTVACAEKQSSMALHNRAAGRVWTLPTVPISALVQVQVQVQCSQYVRGGLDGCWLLDPKSQQISESGGNKGRTVATRDNDCRKYQDSLRRVVLASLQPDA